MADVNQWARFYRQQAGTGGTAEVGRLLESWKNPASTIEPPRPAEAPPLAR